MRGGRVAESFEAGLTIINEIAFYRYIRGLVKGRGVGGMCRREAGRQFARWKKGWYNGPGRRGVGVVSSPQAAPGICACSGGLIRAVAQR
jgi:hypothetical protein